MGCSWSRRADPISIHAPRAGGDTLLPGLNTKKRHFNPRPPCGGRPGVSNHQGGHKKYFNPRPPCGGRHVTLLPRIARFQFQSTPPVRGATPLILLCVNSNIFQSTPPVRGATRHPRLPAVFTGRISIHAPRAGGDILSTSSEVRLRFQSTPPVRGATTSP